MQPYDGDILEHALNFGADSAAKRYEQPVERVNELVQTFAAETYIARLCPCELSRQAGHVVMCFMCTGPV